jgi:hypothetical protein
VLPPRDLGYVHGQRTHAFCVGDDLYRAEDRAQLAGHRLLQRQQRERFLLDSRSHFHDPLVVADDPLGGGNVGVQQSVGRALHRHPGQAAHLAQLRGQVV